MSMIGYIRRITVEEAGKLRNDPEQVRSLVRPGGFQGAYFDRMQGKASPKLDEMNAAFAQARKIKEELMQSGRPPGPPTPEELERLMKPLQDAGVFGDDPRVRNLQKSWHALHYLLCGSADPVDTALGKAILGGEEIGPDVGYGPARLLTPDEVRVVAQALAAVSKPELAARCDRRAMKSAEIYACRGTDDDIDLALECFDDVQALYADAAVHGNAVLLYIK